MTLACGAGGVDGQVSSLWRRESSKEVNREKSTTWAEFEIEL